MRKRNSGRVHVRKGVKIPDKIYLEITNVCILDCAFCHKTAEKKKYIFNEEFSLILDKIEGRAKYLY